MTESPTTILQQPHIATLPGYCTAKLNRYRARQILPSTDPDEVVSFGPLGPEAVHQIAKLELPSASRHEALEQRKLHLRWSGEVVSFLAKREYDTLYGARPLKRLFDIQVMAPLARFW